jgi:hypothetical protein
LPPHPAPAKRRQDLETAFMEAIGIILLFVIALGVLNLVEFGRVD